MKIFNPIALFLLCSLLWLCAGVLKDKHLQFLEEESRIAFGPLPAVENNFYTFNNQVESFDSKNRIYRSKEFTKAEFEELILLSVSDSQQMKLEKYLKSTLRFSEEYQIDPFWVISVMMVESEFNHDSVSSKNAKGLMQIQPDTAQHLFQLMNKKVNDPALLTADENIEVGIFYLKKLLQNFRLNFQHATIAYNMGPAKLKDRLFEENIDVVNYSYLVKVQDSYKDLSSHFFNALKVKSFPYEETYIVKNENRVQERDFLSLYLRSNFMFSASSENLAIN